MSYIDEFYAAEDRINLAYDDAEISELTWRTMRRKVNEALAKAHAAESDAYALVNEVDERIEEGV